MKAEVLNGTVEIGDKVAYGVRDGARGGIRVGTIVDMVPYEDSRYNYETRQCEAFTNHKLKIKVEYSSYYSVGYVTTVSVLDRVVKMGA